MAERRMFAKTIIGSDAFLDMPQSTQALYFHLAMRADDDGFINNPKSIMRLVGCKDDDLKILVSKKFIIPFESGVIVIKHWRIHNYIAKDRYTETKYKQEKELLAIDENGSYTNRIQGVYGCETQVRLGKVSLGKEREEASAVADSPPEGKAKKQAPEEASSLATLLFSLHRDQIDPGFRATPAQLEAWALDIEKLNRIDGRDWPDIEAAIRWIQAPGCFWAPNILSGKKLREKFATVWGQMKRPAGPPPRVASQRRMLEMGD